MKKNIFIGPEIGITIWPMATPVSSTPVTLPSWKEPMRMRPARKPMPMVRKSAKGGYSLSMDTNQSIMIEVGDELT